MLQWHSWLWAICPPLMLTCIAPPPTCPLSSEENYFLEQCVLKNGVEAKGSVNSSLNGNNQLFYPLVVFWLVCISFLFCLDLQAEVLVMAPGLRRSSWEPRIPSVFLLQMFAFFICTVCVFVQSQISADAFTHIRRMCEDTDKKQKAKSWRNGEKTIVFLCIARTYHIVLLAVCLALVLPLLLSHHPRTHP